MSHSNLEVVIHWDCMRACVMLSGDGWTRESVFECGRCHQGVQQNGGSCVLILASFWLERVVLHVDIFSHVCFVAGHDKIFKLHDVANSGMVVGEVENAILVSKFEYADDAAHVDANAAIASSHVTTLATGSTMDAATLISIKKSNIHRPMRVDATTEADGTLISATRVDESSPSSDDSDSTWLDSATAVVPRDHDLAR